MLRTGTPSLRANVLRGETGNHYHSQRNQLLSPASRSVGHAEPPQVTNRPHDAWRGTAGQRLFLILCGRPSGSGDSAIVAVGAENEYANVIGQVGGKYVQVNAIMSNPNTDPHTFEASPSVAREVSAAQLVVQNGVGYDTFMNTIENAAPNPARKVIVVQDLLGLPTDTPNPHLWYKPSTMPAVANAIAAPGRPPARPRRLLQGRRGRFVGSLSAWATRSPHSQVPGHAGGRDRAGGHFILQPDGADNLTPFAFQADIMNGTDPSAQDVAVERTVHPAQGQGVCLQPAGDRHADRIVHHAGAGEWHPGDRRLRDYAGPRLWLLVVDARGSPGSCKRP